MAGAAYSFALSMIHGAPTLLQIQEAQMWLAQRLPQTPTVSWHGLELQSRVGPQTQVFVKLELLQRAGSFKVRGALLNLSALDPASRARGVTAVSSGNHAIATAFAAREFGSSAKVVMLRTSNPARIELCRQFGGEILIAANGAEAFQLAQRIASEEARTFIHPYDGAATILGSATLGLELVQQVGELDAVVIPIGGGGLCAGMASAIKQAYPRCRVFGVEPSGADVMRRSFELGRPAHLETIRTIADSLGAPSSSAMSFSLCRQWVEDLVLVEDDEIRAAMGLIFRELKFAVEPAAAVATAAVIGPLAQRLRGLRVGIALCGTNIDFPSYARHLA